MPPSLGRADRERDVPVADDTIWRLYSMTKPITGVALLTLYERGLFQLGDPVHRYLPEFRGHQGARARARTAPRSTGRPGPADVGARRR